MMFYVQFKNGKDWMTVLADLPYKKMWKGSRNEAVDLITRMRNGRYQKFRIMPVGRRGSTKK